MTDNQMEFITYLITDKLKSCKTIEEVQKAADEIQKKAGKTKVIPENITNTDKN